MQRPAKAMTFQQISIHVLQCPLDVDVHLLFCCVVDLHLTSSNVKLKLDFFINRYLLVPLYVQRPANAMPFQ